MIMLIYRTNISTVHYLNIAAIDIYVLELGQINIHLITPAPCHD